MRGQVVTDHADEPHGREPARRGREVRGASAKHALGARGGRLDGVDADGSGDEKRKRLGGGGRHEKVRSVKAAQRSGSCE